MRGEGPVGFFWQDDTRRAEVERVQLYAQVQQTSRELPIRWFLNEGVQLPRDLERLRVTVESHGFVLVVLDSFYNFATGVDLKDRDAGVLYAALKTGICDRTGCTVLVVDHMPWATESNRTRMRGYGDVFKGAAVRAGIYIDADKKKLYVEARGNNIKGFARTPAYWDADRLELRLIETGGAQDDETKVEQRAEKTLAWLVEHQGGHSTTAVRKAVRGRESVTDEALELLKGRAEVQDRGRDEGPWSGRAGDPRYWMANTHARSEPAGAPAQLVGPWAAEVSGGGTDEPPRPARPTPYRGAEVGRAEVHDVDEAEIERLAEKHRDIAEDQA